jgi:hypothetical protein
MAKRIVSQITQVVSRYYLMAHRNNLIATANRGFHPRFAGILSLS